MTRTRTSRVCRGCYEIRESGNTINPLVVDVTRAGRRRGWISDARWDPDLYRDMIPTKAEAVEAARAMIERERADRNRLR